MKKVLFVCVENSCRSQMAEALGRMLGEGVIECHSSGSRPSGIVNPKAIASMDELGYDLSAHRSKSLGEIPRLEYDYAITMGCGDECPMIEAQRREDWQIPDPKDMNRDDFNRVRDAIRERVVELVERCKSEDDLASS